MPLADVIFYFSLSDSVVIALACALCGMLITLLVYWTGKLLTLGRGTIPAEPQATHGPTAHVTA